MSMPLELLVLFWVVAVIGFVLFMCCVGESPTATKRPPLVDTTTINHPLPESSVSANQTVRRVVSTPSVTYSWTCQPSVPSHVVSPVSASIAPRSLQTPGNQSFTGSTLQNRSRFQSGPINASPHVQSSASVTPSPSQRTPHQTSTGRTLRNRFVGSSEPLKARPPRPPSPHPRGQAQASVNSGKTRVKPVYDQPVITKPLHSSSSFQGQKTTKVKRSTSLSRQMTSSFARAEVYGSNTRYSDESDDDYDDNYRLQYLPGTHPLYDPIEQLFHSTWTSRRQRLRIIKIERVYNKDLFNQYLELRKEWNNRWNTRREINKHFLREASDVAWDIKKKLELFMYNDPLTEHLMRNFNEIYLFHGTSTGKRIAEQGYNLDKSRGGRYGHGLYFTYSADIAHASAAKRETGSTFQVLLSRVLLGNFKMSQETDRSLESPPCLKCGDDWTHQVCSYKRHVPADSIVHIGDGRLFRDFVVYDESQVFPEFRITYCVDD